MLKLKKHLLCLKLPDFRHLLSEDLDIFEKNSGVLDIWA